jgi:hypothetical protein
MLIQPRGFKRKTLSAGAIDSIRRAVESVAARYNCSKSYVIATVLADAFGISEQVRYYNATATQRTKSGKKRIAQAA